MDFRMSLADQLNMHSDLLLDILAWQHVLADLKAKEIAKETGQDAGEVMADLTEKQVNCRGLYIDAVYAKYGGTPKELDSLLGKEEEEE